MKWLRRTSRRIRESMWNWLPVALICGFIGGVVWLAMDAEEAAIQARADKHARTQAEGFGCFYRSRMAERYLRDGWVVVLKQDSSFGNPGTICVKRPK